MPTEVWWKLLSGNANIDELNLLAHGIPGTLPIWGPWPVSFEDYWGRYFAHPAADSGLLASVQSSGLLASGLLASGLLCPSCS